jgi:hypothetical protein
VKKYGTHKSCKYNTAVFIFLLKVCKRGRKYWEMWREKLVGDAEKEEH